MKESLLNEMEVQRRAVEAGWRITFRERNPGEALLFFIPSKIFLTCIIVSKKFEIDIHRHID